MAAGAAEALGVEVVVGVAVPAIDLVVGVLELDEAGVTRGLGGGLISDGGTEARGQAVEEGDIGVEGHLGGVGLLALNEEVTA